MFRRSRLAVVVLGLAGCSGGATGAGPTELPTDATSRQTPTIETLSPTPAVTSGAVAQTSQGPTIDYVVAAGDALFLIADEHCTTADAIVTRNGWIDGTGHALFPGDVIKLPDVPCTPAPTSTGSGSPSSGSLGSNDANDPERVFMQVLLAFNADGGEYEGQFSDPTCSVAYWANFDLERGQSNDERAAIDGLTSLSIPVPDDLRHWMDARKAFIDAYGDDIRRIVDTYVRDGEDAARADQAYPTVAAAVVAHHDIASPAALGTTLVQAACNQFQITS